MSIGLARGRLVYVCVALNMFCSFQYDFGCCGFFYYALQHSRHAHCSISIYECNLKKKSNLLYL